MIIIVRFCFPLSGSVFLSNHTFLIHTIFSFCFHICLQAITMLAHKSPHQLLTHRLPHQLVKVLVSLPLFFAYIINFNVALFNCVLQHIVYLTCIILNFLETRVLDFKPKKKYHIVFIWNGPV
jgi:hypothetical protein